MALWDLGIEGGEAEVLLKGFKLERRDGAVPLWVASESRLEEDGLKRGTAETL